MIERHTLSSKPANDTRPNVSVSGGIAANLVLQEVDIETEQHQDKASANKGQAIGITRIEPQLIRSWSKARSWVGNKSASPCLQASHSVVRLQRADGSMHCCKPVSDRFWA